MYPAVHIDRAKNVRMRDRGEDGAFDGNKLIIETSAVGYSDVMRDAGEKRGNVGFVDGGGGEA